MHKTSLCTRLSAFVDDYAGGGVKPQRVGRMRSHLSKCGVCQQHFATLISCKKFREYVGPYVKGRLVVASPLHMKIHVLFCEPCCGFHERFCAEVRTVMEAERRNRKYKEQVAHLRNVRAGSRAW